MTLDLDKPVQTRDVVTRNWSTNPRDGSLTLSIAVQVNGRAFNVSGTLTDHLGIHHVPMHHVEMDLRRNLMRAVEDHLLGPRP